MQPYRERFPSKMVKATGGAFNKHLNPANRSTSVVSIDENPQVQQMRKLYEAEIAKLRKQVQDERQARVIHHDHNKTTIKRVYDPNYYCWDCMKEFRAYAGMRGWTAQESIMMLEDDPVKCCPRCGSKEIEKETDCPPIHWGYQECRPSNLKKTA